MSEGFIEPPPMRRRTVDWRKFSQLDCMRHPGLPEDEFRDLFSKCGVCGLITTRQVFSLHDCLPKEPDTSEDEVPV